MPPARFTLVGVLEDRPQTPSFFANRRAILLSRNVSPHLTWVVAGSKFVALSSTAVWLRQMKLSRCFLRKLIGECVELSGVASILLFTGNGSLGGSRVSATAARPLLFGLRRPQRRCSLHLRGGNPTSRFVFRGVPEVRRKSNNVSQRVVNERSLAFQFQRM